MHRVLEFNQSQWLRPYIKFNTQQNIEPGKKMEKNIKKQRAN